MAGVNSCGAHAFRANTVRMCSSMVARRGQKFANGSDKCCYMQGVQTSKDWDYARSVEITNGRCAPARSHLYPCHLTGRRTCVWLPACASLVDNPLMHI